MKSICHVQQSHSKLWVNGLLLITLLLTQIWGCGKEKSYAPANGDIVFQVSLSSQSRAIQLATRSKYSHMGIVYVENGTPIVFEAIQPVQTTPLSEWIARGERGHFVAKRLKNSSKLITPETLDRMKEVGRQFEGKKYDFYFEWTDDQIYCSELVWKIYKNALNIELCNLEKLSDFDLSSSEVQAKMKERWGSSPPPDGPMISPAAIYESDLIVEVYSK